jgi:hypothetical protein
MTDPVPDWELSFLERQAAEQATERQQRMMRRIRLGPMPAEFETLAVYNAERARGIVHTAEWDAAMVALQCRFNEWTGLDGT